MRLTISTDGERFAEPVIKPTPPDFDQGLVLIKDVFSQLTGGDKLSGRACFGLSRRVWPNSPIMASLTEVFGEHVSLENDTALVGLGENHAGAGQGSEIMVYVTVSTGVGGVKISRGRIDENALGFEPGQQIINAGSISKPILGRLEDYVSGEAIEKQFGRPPREIVDEKIWSDLSHSLAIGLTNTLLHWSPDCLVLGGSMFKSPGFRVDEVAQLIRRYLTIFPELPTIKPAILGEFGGLHGALVYLRQRS
ncbi:MAG: ROK family protein [Patescibacteria group bacterium]